MSNFVQVMANRSVYKIKVTLLCENEIRTMQICTKLYMIDICIVCKSNELMQIKKQQMWWF